MSSIQRQLASPLIFPLVEEKYILVSVEDWPKQHHERLLLLQGDGRHPNGAAYLGHLLYVSSPEIFEKIVHTHAHGMSDAEAKHRIGTAAMQMHQVLGPLHCKINPAKDAGKFWKPTLLGPLYHMSTGKALPEKAHLRTIVGLLEVLYAGWMSVRNQARPLLLQFAHR